MDSYKEIKEKKEMTNKSTIYLLYYIFLGVSCMHRKFDVFSLKEHELQTNFLLQMKRKYELFFVFV